MSGHRGDLGITHLEAIHYYVRDLARSRRFYTEKLGFVETARSSSELERDGRQRSALFEAGGCRVLCSQPLHETSRAGRWLRRHPEGVGTLIFGVDDVDRTFAQLDARGGTPIDTVRWHQDDGGKLGSFSITTPLGSSTFRFVERRNYAGPGPGLVPLTTPPASPDVGFVAFDHVTTNFETMSPALLWMEHVLGFQEYWGIEFHTEDVNTGQQTGSGLRSQVMWDPRSGVKFACNEPLRPSFKTSQINVFAEDMRGDGIQHVALAVEDIITSVRTLIERGVGFFPTPDAYYDLLPARLERLGVGRIEEPIDTLRELQILVDGHGDGAYLLQIFLQDSATTHQDPDAGPFFYEVIQRKGDRGFGGGNFRALFESIERQQRGDAC